VSNHSSIPIEVPTWGLKAALRRHSMRQQSEVSEAATFVFFGHTAMLLSLILCFSCKHFTCRSTQVYELRTPKRSEAPRSILPEQEAVLFVASEDKATSDSSQGPPPALFRFARKFSLWGPCGGALCGFDHTRRAWGFAVVQRKRGENSCSSCLWTLRATVMHGSPRYQPVSCVP
jgi:hypothetical protein